MCETSRRPSRKEASDGADRRDRRDREALAGGVRVPGRPEPPRRVAGAVDTRRVPGGRRKITYEITEHGPPRRAAFRGLDGPIRPQGSVTVEGLDDGTRSRVTLELDLVGHGIIGKLLAPLARSDARKHIPQDQARLKERLESGAAASSP
ncbi:MAG TPA: SRPBCC family protein [Gaiellaceae bacterium]|nr:SRPBCC family protein [Gaiellaceae bacterium]